MKKIISWLLIIFIWFQPFLLKADEFLSKQYKNILNETVETSYLGSMNESQVKTLTVKIAFAEW